MIGFLLASESIACRATHHATTLAIDPSGRWQHATRSPSNLRRDFDVPYSADDEFATAALFQC